METEKIQKIKEKGFSMSANDTRNPSEQYVPVDFSKISIGMQQLQDAVLDDLYSFKKLNPRLADKKEVQKAIINNDLDMMRDISNFFYRVSGIYNRLCRYLAYMYRYD